MGDFWDGPHKRLLYITAHLYCYHTGTVLIRTTLFLVLLDETSTLSQVANSNTIRARAKRTVVLMSKIFFSVERGGGFQQHKSTDIIP